MSPILTPLFARPRVRSNHSFSHSILLVYLRICCHSSETLCCWLNLRPSYDADDVINEFLQTTVFWYCPGSELWLVIVAKSGPNIPPKNASKYAATLRFSVLMAGQKIKGSSLTCSDLHVASLHPNRLDGESLRSHVMCPSHTSSNNTAQNPLPYWLTSEGCREYYLLIQSPIEVSANCLHVKHRSMMSMVRRNRLKRSKCIACVRLQANFVLVEGDRSTLCTRILRYVSHIQS